MAIKTLNTIIQLRRDTEQNFDKIKNSFIPASGEVVLIDTNANKLRAKIGNGITALAQLPYTDEDLISNINNIIIYGYYLNDNFFTNSTYTVTLPRELNKLYIDNNSKVLYYYDGIKYISINDTLPLATDTVAGISKLYQTGGQNIDGAMSQKTITDGVQSISFILDQQDNECLVLNLPWD